MAGTRKTVEQLYREVRSSLHEAGLPNAGLDARILVAHTLDVEPKSLILHYDKAVQEQAERIVKSHAEARISGTPVGRILGEREFWGLRFQLNEATLEPRSDTETLIEVALEYCERTKGIDYPWTFADIGTGTGAIVVALLSELPNARAVAVDLSLKAAEAALRNARLNGVGDRILITCSSFVDPLGQGFDFIVSNPPYIRSIVVEGLSREVREHDPMLALDGGADGLDAYRELMGSGKKLLKPTGRLVMEIGYDQADDILQLTEKYQAFLESCQKDLGGNDRVVTVAYP
ncbi:peptide chain release factor N(5)-glutamine methyltransferase [Flexibacterium corallicola]|uniref:peptide chain release factor N(5)-glutamine methyltransferase n=1 Tax=Flexibacterium corallicola TaxID=3037259 RepID=UPI00286F4C22|nr:peptide chain release factor N(5)-glutamine methyltransferase [Pseudovibrio sp. M1P-2-3]